MFPAGRLKGNPGVGKHLLGIGFISPPGPGAKRIASIEHAWLLVAASSITGIIRSEPPEHGGGTSFGPRFAGRRTSRPDTASSRPPFRDDSPHPEHRRRGELARARV